MPKHSRYEIHTGPYAGQVLEGHQLRYRATPDGDADTEAGNPDTIPVAVVHIAADGQNHQPTAYTDLVAPFDRDNNPIEVGDTLYAAVAKEVVRVEVTKIGNKHHMGYGWWTRKLRCRNLETGKTVTLNNPSSTIKYG